MTEAARSGHVVGVDLGGTNVRAVLADGAGDVVAEDAAATDGAGAGELIAQIGAMARALAAQVGVPWTGVGAVGVGLPGVVDEVSLRHAPNLPSFDEVSLAAALGEELGVPVVLENDVNAATLGEHRRGCAAGVDDFVFIGLGTGIGMGVVAGGRLVRGATGAAGEIAGMPLGADPWLPANQVHGALEEAVSGGGIARRYAERAAPAGGAELTALDVFAAAEDGDRLAEGVLDDQARALALAVVAVQSVLDPALVVLGGGIGARTDVLERVRARLPRLTARAPALRHGALGVRAGVVGAMQLALEHAAGARGRPSGRQPS